jgi:DNA primase
MRAGASAAERPHRDHRLGLAGLILGLALGAIVLYLAAGPPQLPDSLPDWVTIQLTLRERHPIAEVVAAYGIALRPSGQSLVGRCPFHPDGGRPNFYVYPESRRWYCFRCAIGDAIDFVRRQEGVDFAEACRRLTRLMPRPSGLPAPNGMPRKARRWDRRGLEEQVVLNRACALYQQALWREPRALRYLRERGIPDGVIRACGLGYADGHRLEPELRRHAELRLGHALELFHTPSHADAAQPPREFFAGRIVVPELWGSQCCWLIGRSLDDKPDRPK